MLDSLMKFLNKLIKKNNDKIIINSKEAAKERLHLVLMQDRANVSSDFLELMKKEIIDVIKKYIVVDEKEIDVRLTNRVELDGSNGAPALYANIPIINIKDENSRYCPNLDTNSVKEETEAENSKGEQNELKLRDTKNVEGGTAANNKSDNKEKNHDKKEVQQVKTNAQSKTEEKKETTTAEVVNK